MKYAPLEDYLKRLPAKQTEVTLRFGEIERIIEARLPKSAFTYREWWANQEGSSRAPRWQAAGFVVDTVDLKGKLAYFRRGGATREGSAKKKAAKPKPQKSRQAISAKVLLDAGFKKYGDWELKGDAIRLVGDIPKDPGVYAHILNGKVYYVGVATMGLKKRLYFYARPGSTQRTSIRINALIKNEIEAGNTLELIAAFPEPTSWNGLPVNQTIGLEEGLVKKYAPPWNKRGVVG